MSDSSTDWTDTVANAGLTVAADTVGVLWSAASGTVDPFTKAQQSAQEANDLVTAGLDPATAATQAQNDVTTAYGDADPSNFLGGLSSTWQRLGSSVASLTKSGSGLTMWLAIAVVGILILYLVFVGRQVRI